MIALPYYMLLHTSNLCGDLGPNPSGPSLPRALLLNKPTRFGIVRIHKPSNRIAVVLLWLFIVSPAA